jgi:hypothetical protein
LFEVVRFPVWFMTIEPPKDEFTIRGPLTTTLPVAESLRVGAPEPVTRSAGTGCPPGGALHFRGVAVTLKMEPPPAYVAVSSTVSMGLTPPAFQTPLVSCWQVPAVGQTVTVAVGG